MGEDQSRGQAQEALRLTDGPTRLERASRALYGRRKGKPLRGPHTDLVATLLPALALDLDAPLAADALVQGRRSELRILELRMEIGFGGGEQLAANAQANPGIGYIGCEPFINGVAKLLAEIAARDLANVRLHVGDAGDVIDRLPEASLAQVDIFYPDPWPKRRQQKRRFISDAMLTRLARAMRPGARLRFATDIDDYAGWTLLRILRSRDFDWPAQVAADWTQPWPDWRGTRYEAKAAREGRKPVYLTFVRR